MPGSFYVSLGGGRYASTELTRGPWDAGAQHAGPPAALLGAAVEQAPSSAPMQVARITFEILRPVPIADLSVDASVVKPGRSADLVAGELRDERGVVMTASAWRIRVAELELHAEMDGPARPPLPSQGDRRRFFDTGASIGYHTAMETSFIHGSFREPGPATAWMRMRVPLVEEETVSPLTRVLVAADSGNGISAILDYQRYLFVNPDLTVYLHRLPVSEWVCLDSQTWPEDTGIGMAASTLFDERGPIGRGLQSLLVAER